MAVAQAVEAKTVSKTLVSALDSDMLPALKWLQVGGGAPAFCSHAAWTATQEALERASSRALRQRGRARGQALEVARRRSERLKAGATPS